MFIMYIPVLWLLMSTICDGVNILMPLKNEKNAKAVNYMDKLKNLKMEALDMKHVNMKELKGEIVHSDNLSSMNLCQTGKCCSDQGCATGSYCYGGNNFTKYGSGSWCTCATIAFYQPNEHGTCKTQVEDLGYCGFQRVAVGTVQHGHNLGDPNDHLCQSGDCSCHDEDKNFIIPAEYRHLEYHLGVEDSCWCKPEDGFPEGFACSWNSQCDYSQNLYCDIPVNEKMGTCSPCPDMCRGLGDSCSFCSDPSKMQCGQPSYYDTAMCYLPDPNSVYGYLSNFMDCFGAAGTTGCIMNSYKNNKEELAKCIAGDDCTITIGDGCFNFSAAYKKSASSSTSSFLGIDEQQVSGLSSKQWEQISKRQWGHKFVFSEKDNMNYDDVSIGRDKAFLELDADKKCAPDLFGKADAEGVISTKGHFKFEINPRKLNVKAFYEIELNISAVLSLTAKIKENTGHCEKIIALGGKMNMYSNTFMLGGYFPLSIALDMQPYVWLNADLSGHLQGKVSVTKSAKVRGSVMFNSVTKEVGIGDPVVSQEPVKIVPVLDGQMKLSLAARLGPKVTLTINTIPTELDIAAAAHLNLEVGAKVDQKAICLSGKAEVAASIDAKFSVVFMPNPVDAIIGTCVEAAKATGAAACLGKALVGQSGTETYKSIQEVCKALNDTLKHPAISCVAKFLSAGTDWIVMPLASRTYGANWCSDSRPTNFTLTPNSYSGNTSACQNTKPPTPVAPTPVAPAPVPTPVPQTPYSETCTTTDGTVATGTACFFPFTYRGTIYTECTPVSNGGVPWCSTEATYNGNWGNCECD